MGSSVQRCSKNPRLPTLAETPWRKLSPLRPRFSWMCSRKISFGARKNMEQKHADVKQPSADEKTPATPKRWRELKKKMKRYAKRLKEMNIVQAHASANTSGGGPHGWARGPLQVRPAARTSWDLETSKSNGAKGIRDDLKPEAPQAP